MAKKTTKKTTRRKPAKPPVIEPDAGPEEPIHPAPIPLDDLVGQDRAIANLDAAITSERVHHAWIFHGPPGVGKFTAALAFAAVLLDPETAPDLAGKHRPDPASRTQKLLSQGLHPDLHVIRKELARYSENKQTRDRKLITIPKDVVDTHLLRPAALAPTTNPHGLVGKAFIVDEAELLDRSPTNAPVQNALLKTLEEPAPATIIILVTSAEDRLLPTIRSRCQRVAFSPLDDQSLAAWAKKSGLEIPAADQEWLFRYAQGSPGRLAEAIETGMAAWGRELEPRLRHADQGRFDPTLAPTMTDLVDQWAAAFVEVDSRRSKDAANRLAAARMFQVIAERARPDLASGAHAERGLRTIAAIADAERRLASNVMMRDVFEGLAADLSAG